MKKLEVRFTRAPDDELRVGALAEERGRVYFEYDRKFLATELNLSPFRLPFSHVLYEHTSRDFGPLPGLFDDSLPDGWGLLLMNRHFRSTGMNPTDISPLDRLAWLGTRTMGALTYHPPAECGEVNRRLFDLHELGRHSQEILEGAAVEVLPQLLRAGGSPGGARPKVLMGFNQTTGEIISGEGELPAGFDPWLVKFFARNDSPDAGAVEYAYSRMAAAAGIDMPRTYLFKTASGDRYFGVSRFDRRFNRRFHIHTFGNLIESNFRIPSADYADLFKVASLLTRNHQEVLQVFRRMIFNVLSHNRDDHVKNFSFLLDDETPKWTLAPAYDLLWTPGPGGEHTMTVAGEGRSPGRSHFLKLAGQAGLSKREAQHLIEEVRAAVSSWRNHASQAGVSEESALNIADSLSQIAV